MKMIDYAKKSLTKAELIYKALQCYSLQWVEHQFVKAEKAIDAHQMALIAETLLSAMDDVANAKEYLRKMQAIEEQEKGE